MRYVIGKDVRASDSFFFKKMTELSKVALILKRQAIK